MSSIKKIRFFALQATLFVACISMMFAACGEGNVNPDDNETHIHTYGTRVLRESTCKDEGEVLYFCLGCSESYCSSLPVSDHKFTDTQKEATCTEEGYLLQTCIVCDMQKKTVNEQKKAHVFQEETYTQEDGSIIKKERNLYPLWIQQ